MSKYNLTDILEQYKIGSGWTTDFDYDGMLNVGLKTSIDTPIEVLKKMSDDFEDVNYHRENSHLQDAIDAIEIGDMKEAEGRLNDFHVEIRKTQEEQGMDIEPTLGKFMDTKMSSMMNEDEFDEARQAAIESSQKAAGIKEAREFVPVDGEVSTRIEGLLDINGKKRFLSAFKTLFYDLVEDEAFDLEDIVAHLSNEMGNAILGDPVAMDRLPYLDKSSNDDDFEQEEFTAIDEEDSIEEAQYAPEVVDRIEMARKALYDTNKFDSKEIEVYIKSLVRDFDKGDFEAYDDYEADDYVEDMNNYIADKSLQEHFKRFM